MRLDIITLFPAMFEGPFSESLLKRAREKRLVQINLVQLRDYADDARGTVDDRPYGGGAGMVLKPEPLCAAIEAVRTPQSHVILTSPAGRPFTQAIARELATRPHLVLICGHYEGVDERVRQTLVDDELSIGDYVLTSGNLPAMVIAEAVVRLLPGVLGNADSPADESFSAGLLEYPQYTRPEVFRGLAVPEVLRSGNHQAVAAWRHEQALARTRSRRPDLLTTQPLNPGDPRNDDHGQTQRRPAKGQPA